MHDQHASCKTLKSHLHLVTGPNLTGPYQLLVTCPDLTGLAVCTHHGPFPGPLSVSSMVYLLTPRCPHEGPYTGTTHHVYRDLGFCKGFDDTKMGQAPVKDKYGTVSLS